MTAQKPTPATDEEISVSCDLNGWGTDEFQHRLIARIQQDAATIEARAKEIERKEQWLVDEIEKLYPVVDCGSCRGPLDPEDGSTHVDHFLYWAGRR